MLGPVSRSRVRAAWIVAVAVDALQLATSPAELAGPLAWMVESGADLATMAVMTFLLGFHWVFLPSFVTKLLPIADLAPTWTVAVFLEERERRRAMGREQTGKALPRA